MSLHKKTIFTGVATALITPFNKGQIDYDAVARLIERQIDGSVDAILVAGTTGEGSTLSMEEYRDLVTFAKETVGGRVPLLAGCGSNATDRAVKLARDLCAAGADALLSVTPYYNKASDKGLTLHFQTIAEAISCPIILYSVPARTGVKLTMKHYRVLAEHENIVGVKEASGDLELVENLCAECGDDLDVYTGNDRQTLATYKLGGQGVISVLSNILPREMSDLCRLCAAREYRAAAQRQQALLARMDALFCEVNPIPVKYVAALKGLCAAEYRLPLCPPAPDSARFLQSLFY